MTVRDCVDSPPVGDGWGWDGVTSCRIEVGDNQPDITTIVSNTMGTSCRNTENACIDGTGVDLGPRFVSDPNNIIRNATFDGGDNSDWSTYIHPQADASFDLAQFEDLRLSVFNASVSWHIRAFALDLELEAGRTYRLSFDHELGSRMSGGTSSVAVESAIDYTQYLPPQEFQSSIVRLRYQIDFFMPVTDSNVRVSFNLGDNFGAIWFDNVVLVALN